MRKNRTVPFFPNLRKMLDFNDHEMQKREMLVVLSFVKGLKFNKVKDDDPNNQEEIFNCIGRDPFIAEPWPEILFRFDGLTGKITLVKDRAPLEILETVMMKDAVFLSAAMQQWRDMGVTCAIDDFGTEYSSLGRLNNLPVTVLKISREFLKEIQGDSLRKRLLGSVISLAHTLNLEVVVEGVETEQQLQLIKEMQGDTIQGYLFSKPVSSENVSEIIETGYIVRTNL